MPLSKEKCKNLSGNELTRNLSENTRPQSSQLAGPLWTDPGIESGISVRELISTQNFKKIKHRCGMNYRTFSPNSRKRAFFSDYLTFAQCAKWQPVLQRKTINFAVTTLPLYSVQNGRQFCSGKLVALQ